MMKVIRGNSININTFYCPCCFGNTKHIKISYEEAYSKFGEPRLLGALADITGFGRIASIITNGYYWKCTECATMTIRKNNGLIIRILDEFK